MQKGEDPALDKKKIATESITMRELSERYISEYAEIYLKPKTIYNDKLNIKNHIIPNIGDIPVLKIDKDDLKKLHLSLHKKPVTANHVKDILSKMLNLAEEWGLCPEGSNPTRFIKVSCKIKRALPDL